MALNWVSTTTSQNQSILGTFQLVAQCWSQWIYAMWWQWWSLKKWSKISSLPWLLDDLDKYDDGNTAEGWSHLCGRTIEAIGELEYKMREKEKLADKGVNETRWKTKKDWGLAAMGEVARQCWWEGLKEVRCTGGHWLLNGGMRVNWWGFIG